MIFQEFSFTSAVQICTSSPIDLISSSRRYYIIPPTIILGPGNMSPSFYHSEQIYRLKAQWPQFTLANIRAQGSLGYIHQEYPAVTDQFGHAYNSQYALKIQHGASSLKIARNPDSECIDAQLIANFLPRAKIIPRKHDHFLGFESQP